MNAYRPLGPFPQFLLADGTVNNGGLIHFYQTDLTTLQNTWSDMGMTVLNANPVVLDASGRPTTDIWGSAAYGVVITDALGANPRTFNNIQPASGSGSAIPALVNGDFLTNNGSVLLWQAISQLPDPTGHAGQILFTDGTLDYWAALPTGTTSSGVAGKVIIGAVMLQYGTATAPQPSSGSHSTTVNITFPTAFSSIGGCWISYTGGSATGVGGNAIPRSAASTTGSVVQFDINDFSNNSGGMNTSIPFQWLAIGLA
jgi:hypothetical protein